LVVAIMILALSAGIPATPGATSGPDEPLTASALLERMTRAYSGCRSYHDTGTEKTVFTSEVPVRVEERPFHTAFVRPDRFRFEFADRGKRFIIWRSGSQVHTWWDIDSSLESPESLDDAIAGATGISGGSAHTVPLLLMPAELKGRRLAELAQVSRLPDALLGQTDCFRIEGKVGGLSETIWLDKGTYLVRKIEEQLPARFGATETTSYEAALDEDISDNLLAFDPPVDLERGRRLSWAAALVGGAVLTLLWWFRRRQGHGPADLGPGAVQ
jgi:outer membrane lipoprotein-sorting protein